MLTLQSKQTLFYLAASIILWQHSLNCQFWNEENFLKDRSHPDVMMMVI